MQTAPVLRGTLLFGRLLTVDDESLARLQVPRGVVQRRVDGVARDERVVVAGRRLEAPHARRHVAVNGNLVNGVDTKNRREKSTNRLRKFLGEFVCFFLHRVDLIYFFSKGKGRGGGWEWRLVQRRLINFSLLDRW